LPGDVWGGEALHRLGLDDALVKSASSRLAVLLGAGETLICPGLASAGWACKVSSVTHTGE
jgi:hypothetical protein